MFHVNTIKDCVKSRLKASRYQHTLGVVKYAVMLAELYDVDKKKAEVAALLHDYCKYDTSANILDILKSHDAWIHPVVLHNPNLGHGSAAKYIIQETFNIDDPDVLGAIEHHTFGKPNMSPLEKIIYLADSLEENRQYEGIEEVREVSKMSLDLALIKAAQNTLIYEIKHGHMVHENTVLMLNALLEAESWK